MDNSLEILLLFIVFLCGCYVGQRMCDKHTEIDFANMGGLRE